MYTMENESTLVRVYEDTWKRLNAMKEPGDTFNDVITRLLDRKEEGDPTDG